MRKFSVVKEEMRRTDGDVTLPTRADYGSAGYDFYANAKYKCEPNKVTKIWTDVKAYMNVDEVLLLNVRSSMGGKFRLANTVGVIDSSYVDNESNDGNIGIFLINTTDEDIVIERGERIGQGIFIKYLTTDNDEPLSSVRTGGFGSTNK